MSKACRRVCSFGCVVVILTLLGCTDSTNSALNPFGERELDIQIPSTSEAFPLIVQPNDIFVNLDAEGNLFMAGEQMSLDELEAYLAALPDDKTIQHTVTIRADGRCQLRDVVTVINLCNRLRISHSLTTATPSEAESPAGDPSPSD